jgi:DNA-binding NarL/FixJ family response regulator
MKQVEASDRQNKRERSMIRVMVVDDHPFVRDGICKLINLEDDLEVVATASDGQEVLDTVMQIQPDVILLDLSMPGMDGLGVLQSLKEVKLDSKVILLTASEENKVFVKAMKDGCSGIVVKISPPDVIIKAIRKVHDGEIWLDLPTTTAVLGQFSGGATNGKPPEQRNGLLALSKREQEVTTLVSKGLRNSDIADKLSISEQTVKNHMHNIFDKLGVSDRLELALYAIHSGLPLD